MRFLPLSKENRPLIPYKDHPVLSEGLEYGDWVDEAVENGFGVGTFLDNSGLVVIDTDSTLLIGRKTEQVWGWSNFQDVCREVGLPGIPETFTVQTKTQGHYHFYFQQHPDYPLTRTSIHSQIPQVDVKVTGYVVSWHTDGYHVARPAPVRVLPRQLAAKLYRPPAEHNGSTYTHGDYPVTADYAEYLLIQITHTCNGERNARLYKTAKTFQEGGLTTAQDRSRLMQAAMNAGLRETEAERTISSAWGG